MLSGTQAAIKPMEQDEKDRPTAEKQGAYETALVAALHELAALKRQTTEFRSRIRAGESQESSLSELIRALAARLPADLREKFSAELADLQPPVATRGGPVLESLTQVLARAQKREWTAAEIREALKRQGIDAETKAVTNGIDYLVRTKRLKRITRGHYMDPEVSVAIITSDEVRTTDIARGGENED